jgi:hypothetical protein
MRKKEAGVTGVQEFRSCRIRVKLLTPKFSSDIIEEPGFPD